MDTSDQIELLHQVDDVLSDLVHDLRYCFNRIQVRTFLRRRHYGCILKIVVKPRNRDKTFMVNILKLQSKSDLELLKDIVNTVKALCQKIYDSYA